LEQAKPGRQLNNFNLTEQAPILESYRQLIAPAYFLSEPVAPDGSVALPLALRDGQSLPRSLRLNIWTKTYTTRQKLFLVLGDKLLWTTTGAGAHEQSFDIPSSIAQGKKVLSLYVYDEQNRFVQMQCVNINLSS
jgi:hypothetical protein